MTTRKAPLDADVSDRVWTLPNAISALRILLILAFATLLALGIDGWAITTLAVAGISDFFDGFLARRWNQVTRLGRILDPAADRLLTLTMVIGLPLRGIIPWWLAGILISRDLVVGIALVMGKRRGVPVPQVTFLGKTATFGLYVFMPLTYLAWERWDPVYITAILWTVVFAALYWASGIGYVKEARNATLGIR